MDRSSAPGGESRALQGLRGLQRLRGLRGPLSGLMSAVLLVATYMASAVVPGSSAVAGQPQLVVETGAHSAFVRRLAVAGRLGAVITASDDKTARVWDLATGELRQVLRPAVGPGEIGRLYGVAAHPTEDLVAIGGTTGARPGEHRILLFSISSGVLLRSFDARGGDIKKLAWSADGTLIFAVYAGQHALRAFDADGVMRHELMLGGPSYGLAVAADGTVAASSYDGQIVVLAARSRQVSVMRSFRTRTAEPVGLAFSPDASRLAAGFRTPDQAPEVYDARAGRFLFKLERAKVEAGSHRTVAWSDDGRTIAVSGSGYTTQRSFPVFFHDATTGRLAGQQDVALDTIFDLVSLPGSRFAYASGDGSWGVLSAERVEFGVRAAIADLKGPENLYVDPSGTRVGWANSWGRNPAQFDFSRRLVATDRTAALRKDMLAPKAKRGAFDSSVWQDSAKAEVNGGLVALDPAEVSRALSYFRSGSDAVLGTSHRLLRIGERGRILWEVRNADEVRSVNTTADDRMIVTGMSDGTLRWWRASDGALLMSLLATRDRRWVVWTPEGFFDASAGADRLAGWTVNRGSEPGADHFSLNRFRERFNRPDLIDQVLRTGTPVAAFDPSTTLRTAATQPAQPASGYQPASGHESAPGHQPAPGQQPGPVITPQPPPTVAAPAQFPPVIAPINLATLAAGPGDVKIPVVVRADSAVSLEVRVDGRPVKAEITQSAASAGTQSAVATVPTPEPGSLVQVLAKDRNGVSEPSGFLMDPGAARSDPGTPGAATAAVAPVLLRPPGVTSPVLVPSVPVELPGRATTSPGPAPAPLTGASRQTRLYVLAIGISDYKRPEYKLGLAAKDARDFAEAMRQQSGKLYREVLTRTLVNKDATRLAIIANLKWLSDTVGPGDLGMLFIAGHGMNGSTGQYYFLPYEGNHEQLAESGLPEGAIRDTLGRMRGKALFFVDTCFGGNVVGNFTSASRELARLANDLAATENGVVVFASSSGRQLSEENDAWGNGAFTKAVLAGLSGKADLTRSGRITFKALDFYISEEVNKLTEGRQTPVTISPLGVPDFTIARVDS